MEQEIRLPWRIEAFGEYLTFETLQPAAAVLSLFEGERFSPQNPEIQKLHRILEDRTNKSAWVPKRSGAESLNWNIEGDVTRNKGRVFTSMLIMYPKEWEDNKILLTPFGKALASGKVDKTEYYDFLLKNFSYPHPAWKDNWTSWTKAKRSLYPFIYIIQVLLILYQHSKLSAYLTTEEIADHLHNDPDHSKVKIKSDKIINARVKKLPSTTPRSDEIHRKISDIMRFLCLTQYCYYDGHSIALNTLDYHQLENVTFTVKRKGQDKIKDIEELIKMEGGK
jgi:hypothetical protein